MKRIVHQLLLLLFFLSSVLTFPASAALFNDVPETHPAAVPVDILTERKIMTGVTYERFGGEINLNRFQLAEALNTLLGNRNVNESIILFSDLLPGSPQYKTVTRVISADLIYIEGSSFEGLRPVTRYELAESIHKLLKYMSATPPPPPAKRITYKDPIKPDFKDAVDQVTNIWQITSGLPNGTFQGDRNITRNEAAFMLIKVASLIYEDIRAEWDSRKASVPQPTPEPTGVTPTMTPTGVPTTGPSASGDLECLLDPSKPGCPAPTAKPSTAPTPKPSVAPSAKPTPKPTVTPTAKPTPKPTPKPSTAPTAKPSTAPTAKPTPAPTPKPSTAPSATPSGSLQELECLLNGNCSASPKPSAKPSSAPSSAPTPKPSTAPTAAPTAKPTVDPRLQELENLFGTPTPPPTAKPTAAPTAKPTPAPTAKPSAKPTAAPSAKPTAKPTAKPSAKPTPKPTAKPSAKPTAKPSAAPSAKPTPKPTATPGAVVSASPKPSGAPLITPTPNPSLKPSTLSELEKQFESLRNPSPSPTASSSARPEQPDSLVQVPLPTAAPSVAPSAVPSLVPSVMPTLPPTGNKPPLRSRMLLMGNYRFIYEERVPTSIKEALKMPDTQQTVSGDAGLAVQLNTLFWFGEPYTTLGNLGVAFDLQSLGGFTFDGSDLTDLVTADLAVMYKLYSSPNFDFAAGLDGYYRMTSSSQDPRTNYFKAARSYIGAGARLSTAYRIIEPLSLELHIAPHYVMQDLSNIQLEALPLNRFDTQIQFLINWDMFSFGSSKLSLDVGYQGLLMFDLGSEGSQMIHGGIFGLGYHF